MGEEAVESGKEVETDGRTNEGGEETVGGGWKGKKGFKEQGAGREERNLFPSRHRTSEITC